MITLIMYMLHKHKLNCYFKGSNPKWLSHWDALGPREGIEYRERAYTKLLVTYAVLWFMELGAWVFLVPAVN